MSRSKLRKKKQERKDALKKVPQLFERAQRRSDQKMATRTVGRARRLAMKFRFSLSKYKHLYCKHCYERLVPGYNSRVRIRKGKIVQHCSYCKRFRRTVFK